MNKRYIDSEAAIELLSQPITMSLCLSVDECHHKIAQQRIDRYLIESIPAADVRPVVFCKDCDCWNDWDSAGKESLGNYVCSCAHWSVEDGPVLYTRPTDFCSYGEMREES